MRAGYRYLFLLGTAILCAFLTLPDGMGFCQGKEAAADLTIQVPDSGPMTQRVKQLWQTTRPLIETDAKANLSEAHYQARRGPLFGAWVKLQVANSMAPTPSDEVGRLLIPRILELINHVYGFPGFSEAKRVKQRQNVGRTAYLIKEIEQKQSKLP